MDTILLDQLIAYCYSRGLTEAEAAPVRGSMSRDDFCDAFSRRVAHQYAASQLSFEAADAAINRLFGYGFSGGNSLPDYSMEVFTAFDDGEYVHSGDPEDDDPEVRYTQPQIQKIVARDLTE